MAKSNRFTVSPAIVSNMHSYKSIASFHVMRARHYISKPALTEAQRSVLVSYHLYKKAHAELQYSNSTDNATARSEAFKAFNRARARMIKHKKALDNSRV